MSFVATLLIGVLFVFFVLASLGGVIASFRQEFTGQEVFVLVFVITLTVLLGILLFTGSLSIY
jgi:hypothetical protein